ncbi:hypothetical protein [Sphingobium chungbukense]|uniref:Uncharacterized protein n=1 Tax=Sphingobium chungbukense TaxID=56193 RepID=A0A0M3AZH5_9SPHN|nr:hypothetical protein [Sphingobium chungbukense]KKW93959.1 hypothetical protein YP76_04810 [Sphingobium chungbukense]
MEKVVTKKSFIGGRLVYPGEKVDVDAKGEVMPAASTPIGSLTVDQLRALLAQRESEEDKPEPVFGTNVADPTDENTGSQPLEVAPIAPASPGSTRPQGLPPGSVPVGDTFLAPASEDAPVAVEEIVAPGGSLSEQVEKAAKPAKGKASSAKEGE